MAAQANPTYKDATGKVEEPIVIPLIQKYGIENVCWPIVLSNSANVLGYLYEINKQNSVNLSPTEKPVSASGLPDFHLDYCGDPRTARPNEEWLEEFIKQGYDCSYDFVPRSIYSTVDLDYVWTDGSCFKGFELTTFYVHFSDKNHAANLVAKMNRRQSWQGPEGAHALHRIADAALDLRVTFYLVCVNTTGGVGSSIDTSSSVYFFPLTHQTIDRLSSGRPIDSSQTSFMSFDDFIKWL